MVLVSERGHGDVVMHDDGGPRRRLRVRAGVLPRVTAAGPIPRGRPRALGIGPSARPEQLVESLRVAVGVLVAVVRDAAPDVRAVIFRRPEVVIAAPRDFLPRGAMELILHAHDVCSGLGVSFEPPADVCARLREHTRPWPMWTFAWNTLSRTEDPWGDLLTASDRRRSLHQ